MNIPLASALSIALLVPAARAVPAPERIAIELTDFAFAPAALRLRKDRPYLLHFVNKGSGGHNYSAPAFFAAARIDPADAAFVRKGTVEVARGQSRAVRLVPAAGSYKVKCTHFMHPALGMRGSIVVD